MAINRLSLNCKALKPIETESDQVSIVGGFDLFWKEKESWKDKDHWSEKNKDSDTGKEKWRESKPYGLF